MKSIFRKAIVAIFGAMMVCGFANAQGDVTVILEAHNVWGDGRVINCYSTKTTIRMGLLSPKNNL